MKVLCPRAAILGLLALTFVMQTPQAMHYYIASEGGSDGNSGSSALPWATFDHAVSRLTPGDTLFLFDGTYHQSLNVRVNGLQWMPITIRALNDGKAIIDGDGQRIPATFGAWNTADDGYLIVEGIVFQNSSASVVTVYSHHNTFRRCSAYYGRFGANDHCWNLAKATYTVLEDCVAAATERHLFLSWTDDGRETHNTFRRCFGVGTLPGLPDTASMSEFNCYGGSYDIFENCIGWGGGRSSSISLHSQLGAQYKCRGNKVLGGIFLRAGDTPDPISGVGLRINHSGGENPRDILVENSVIYGSAYGVSIGEEGSVYSTVLSQCTILNNQSYGFRSKSSDITFKNSILCGNGFAYSAYHRGTCSYLDIHGNNGEDDIPSEWPNCISVDPCLSGVGVRIPSDSPCCGAGENGADIGATVQNRYHNGVLTQTPLWPWPMRDRIRDELGIDVDAELEDIFGPLLYTPCVGTTFVWR